MQTNSITLHQTTDGSDSRRSRVSFDTTTVINVDSVAIHSAAFGSTATKTEYRAGDHVYVRAVISDPFGSYDVNRATLTLTDPSGANVLSNAAMTQVAESVAAATRTFEYDYVVPAGARAGVWGASVTGHEGTENTVSHTRIGSFEIASMPELVVVKSVTTVSNPVEGTTRPKALPGAIMRYEITISNEGGAPVDINSLVLTDPIPANTDFVVNSGSFVDGSPSSGLTLTSGYVTYSSNGGSTWSYVPTADARGADSAVTHVKFSPQGTLKAKTGASAPSFKLRFNVVVD